MILFILLDHRDPYVWEDCFLLLFHVQRPNDIIGDQNGVSKQHVQT